MLKLQIGMVFAIIFLLLTGCSGNISEPAFLTETPDRYKGYSKVELMKNKALSDESAKLGWKYLSKYFNKNSFVPAVNRSYIADAMRCFNYCWSFNNNNCQAYWGPGVIRGIQATLTDDKTLIEKYLKQSVEFLLLAKKYDVPTVQINNLNLDLANSYNGLGAFYLNSQKKKLANTNLELARVLLLDVIQKKPENGRAFFLLATTCFYQEKFDDAKRATKQAQNKHYKVPEKFLKDLHLPDGAIHEQE